MNEAGTDDALALAFEEQRERLVSMAYRMLGSQPDAEDAVQETWFRLARQDAAAIENLAGWLTTVVGRVCIDMLRSRKSRPEVPFDDRLADWVVTDDSRMPEREALLADSVALALLLILDTLGPAERLALVLHDMFGVPFAEIAQILDKSTDSAKMLASRARRKVKGRSHAPDRHRQREVVDAFIAAARSGDFEALLRVLDPDVVWRGHTPRGVVVHLGAATVAGKFQNASRAKSVVRRVLVNDEPGVMAWAANGSPQAVMACTVVGGRIVEIVSVVDPNRLAAMNLPPAPAER